MKRDGEIKLLREERQKGVSHKLAAARTGMSERTARKYECAGKLPSQMKKPRTHRTRKNPFSLDWPWVEEQLKRDSALQAKTLFARCVTRFQVDIRKASYARCSDTFRRGGFVMARSRRSCFLRSTFPGAWLNPISLR
ncbi:hypothetical protein SB861_45460 [Paraburkholderia sp. SIMBA_049]